MALDKMAHLYQVDRDNLARERDAMFPKGTPVFVESSRYTGTGVSAGDSEQPADMVAVLLPNGNVWSYPIETVHATYP